MPLKRFNVLRVTLCVMLLHSALGEEKLKKKLTNAEIVQRIDSFIEAGLQCHNYPGPVIIKLLYAQFS